MQFQIDGSLALSRIAALVAATALTGPLALSTPAFAGNGGVGAGGGSGSGQTVPGSKAKLVHGKAIPPADAPQRVVKAIQGANAIRNKPYVWGGGHSSWRARGYDCSGAISYALHRGRLLNTPLDSTGFESWGKGGKGSWITVYANSGHAYVVIAGLRWDTSQTAGDGPSWSKQMVSSRGYKVRHAQGF